MTVEKFFNQFLTQAKSNEEKRDYKEARISCWVGVMHVQDDEAYKEMGIFYDLISYYSNLLGDAEEENKTFAMAIKCSYALEQTKKYNEALELFNNILASTKKLKKSDKIAAILQRIGLIYTNFLNDIDKGLKYYDEAMEYGFPKINGAILNNKGGIYYKKMNYDKALEYYEQALELAEKIGDDKFKSVVLHNIQETLAKMKGKKKKRFRK